MDVPLVSVFSLWFISYFWWFLTSFDSISMTTYLFSVSVPLCCTVGSSEITSETISLNLVLFLMYPMAIYSQSGERFTHFASFLFVILDILRHFWKNRLIKKFGSYFRRFDFLKMSFILLNAVHSVVFLSYKFLFYVVFAFNCLA